MTLMMGYGRMEELRLELNSIYSRADAPGFGYIREGKHIPEFEQELAQLKPAFEARLKDQIEKGKYSAPGPSAQTQAPSPQPQTPTAQPPASTTPGKNIPGLDQSLSNGEWVPAANQDELNKKLILHARSVIELGRSEQPRGNRVFDAEKYIIRETPDSLSVFLKDTNKTVEQKGDTITGQARQADIDLLRKGNIVMKQLDAKMEKSAQAEMGE